VSGDEFFGHGTAPNSVAIQTKNQADRSCVGIRTETGVPSFGNDPVLRSRLGPKLSLSDTPFFPKPAGW
jgi:hypothetical protein